MQDDKYLKNISCIDSALFQKIRKEGTKTGSKVFGGWGKGDDIDFILPTDFYPNWSEGIHKNIYCLSSEADLVNEKKGIITANAKTENGTILHLIFPQSNEAYQQWINATELIIIMIEQNEEIKERLQNKRIRKNLFKSILEIFE